MPIFGARANWPINMGGSRAITTVDDLLARLPRGYEKSFDWSALVLREPCVYCGETLPCSRDAKDKPDLRNDPRLWQGVEHIVPRSRGGSNNWENKVSACYWCNVTRKDGSLLLFILRRQELLSPAQGMAEPRTSLRGSSNR
jgi:hypothetical protein